SCDTSSPRGLPAVRRPLRRGPHRLTLRMDALNLARHAGLTWWRNWLALTVLNLVWMVSWLTVVLGPPVTLAVYSYIERLVAGDDLTPREFVTAVTANFAKAWLWALPVLASMAGWVVAVSFYALVGDVWARAAEVAASLIVLAWLFVQFY